MGPSASYRKLRRISISSGAGWRLEIKYRDKNIAAVLGMTVDAAFAFFAEDAQVRRSLDVLQQVGLGYLRLGQPATELSGGEAQRIKLATELQRTQRGDTLYVLDEPTTGLHPAHVERLIAQLNGLVESGNTVIVVEHDMRVAAGSDWVMDIGPGVGDEGGHVVAFGTPVEVAGSSISRTAPYLSPSRLSLAVSQGVNFLSSARAPGNAKRSLRKEGCGADSLGVRKHVVVDRNQPVRALGVARLLR